MRKLKFIFLLLCGLMCTISTLAQHTIKGIVKDSKEQFIIGASVVVKFKTDSLYYKGCTTDGEGQFAIEGLASGDYILEISFLGYLNHHQNLKLNKTMDLGIIHLQEKSLNIDEVVVTASMVKRFADRKEYKLTNAEKRQYSSSFFVFEFASLGLPTGFFSSFFCI